MLVKLEKKGYNCNMNMRKGSVSLYVVIFTTMLLSIISLGFLRIMMGEQTAARNQDLSNSAFDSAMAGVEDAKVVVLAYQECASRGWPAGGVARGLICSNVRDAIEQGGCDTVQIARLGNVGGVGRPETGLDQGFASGDGESAALDQAYTCVTIQPSTPDFLAQISSQQPSLIVPLRFQQEVTDIIIRWWRSADADGVDPVISNRCDDRGLGCFPEQDAWGNTEPPVMRWQLINPGSGFSLDTLNQPNAHASLFFVPTSGGTEIWN
ncbi:hypothetical protein FWH09_02120, partial [Candidatus Saccharibacteria bacterium]|nr:hypothetical protein [Candidatus Saccharibacteria bacterium]